MMDEGQHLWITHANLICCQWCGIVKRRDGLNRPCKGVVRVTLREAAQKA